MSDDGCRSIQDYYAMIATYAQRQRSLCVDLQNGLREALDNLYEPHDYAEWDAIEPRLRELLDRPI